MSKDIEIRCEHCGGTCEDVWELQVYHRGCRLRAAFPSAYTSEGGLLKFDISKIAAELKKLKKGS